MIFDIQKGEFVRLRTILDEVQGKYIPDLQNLADDIVSGIQSDKLSGDPLHRISGLLSDSLYGKVYRQYDQVSMSFGEPASVPYAPIHEFGGTFTVRSYIQHQLIARNGKRRSVVTGRYLPNYRDIRIQSGRRHFPERSYLRSYMSEHEREIITRINGIVGKRVERWPN